MRLVVQDANIMIDLIDCGLFELFFRLELEVITTSLVLNEINETEQKRVCKAMVAQDALHVVEIGTLGYLRLQSLELPGLSVPDRSVLKLAEEREASLLTGDGKLRRTAESASVEVCGILWVFDQLVSVALLSRSDAHDKLSQLSEKNPRLPKREIERRLLNWAG